MSACSKDKSCQYMLTGWKCPRFCALTLVFHRTTLEEDIQDTEDMIAEPGPASHHRTSVHSWSPQAEQPAVSTQDRTCLCSTAVWSPPESFHPDTHKSNTHRKGGVSRADTSGSRLLNKIQPERMFRPNSLWAGPLTTSCIYQNFQPKLSKGEKRVFKATWN